MSMAKFFLKAAKAILVGMAATAVGYAGYKTVTEAKRKASGAVRETPEDTVFKFEGEIINTDTHESRTVGCEAKDDLAAYTRFMSMCESDEHVGSYDVTDFPDGYSESEAENGSTFHYGTVEEYKALQEPLTKKERRTVFFKQLGISAKDRFLDQNLIDTLMFSALGLASLRLGELCGRDLLKEEQTEEVLASAKSYGMNENTPWAVKLAAWICDGCSQRGDLPRGNAVVFGALDNGTRFISNDAVITDENGTKSVKFSNIN